MSEIVITSDSDDSTSLTQTCNLSARQNEAKKQSLLDGSTFDDFSFPEVAFYYAADPEPQASFTSRNQHNDLSDNELDVEIGDLCPIPSTSGSNCQARNIYHMPQVHAMSDSESESEPINTGIEDIIKDKASTVVKGKNKKTARNVVSKQQQVRRKEAKQIVRGNTQRDKLLKEIAAKKLKNAKDDECMKFIEVVIDEGINELTYFNDIVTALEKENVRYNIHPQLIPNSVTWKRTWEDYIVSEDNEIETTREIVDEDHILIVLNWYDTVKKITENTLHTFISSVKTLTSNCDVTLVVYGIEDYFTYWKKHKNNAKGSRDQVSQQSYSTAPRITRDQLGISLIHLQIMLKCNNRMIETSADLALMIYNYTKAIAQRPHRLEKEKKLADKLEWFMMIDETDTVKVDKNGNGLKKLWQRQLCDFNNSGLEIAEAICAVYPTPASLIEAYRSCTNSEGANLLKDIPIRRAAGPLTTARKVGPELSRKIHIMFTATDGETLL